MVALNGRFIQGASEAGKRGGAAGKGKIYSDAGKTAISKGLLKSYEERESPLKGLTLGVNESKARKGEQNGMFGKTHTPESIALMKANLPFPVPADQ